MQQRNGSASKYNARPIATKHEQNTQLDNNRVNSKNRSSGESKGVTS